MKYEEQSNSIRELARCCLTVIVACSVTRAESGRFTQDDSGERPGCRPPGRILGAYVAGDWRRLARAATVKPGF